MRTFRLAPDNMTFNFMRLRRVSYPFSAFMSIVSVVMFIVWGLNFGIDFSGGTLLEVRANSGVADLAQLRSLGDKYNLGEVEVQAFGGNSDATVRMRLQPGGDADAVADGTGGDGFEGSGFDGDRFEEFKAFQRMAHACAHAA